MNYESQLFRQVVEQPEYVPQNILPFQRAGVIRYSPQCIQFGPLFFNQVSALQQQLRQNFDIQEVSVQASCIGDVCDFIQSVRTVKALPLCLAEPAVVQNQLNGRFKSVYDQKFHFVAEQLDIDEIAEKIKKVLGLKHSAQQFYGVGISNKEFSVNTEHEQLVLESDKPMEKIHTPAVKTMQELEDFLKIPKSHMMKLVCFSFSSKLVFIHIRGDLNVSMSKVCYQLGLNPFTGSVEMADAQLLAKHGLVEGFGGFFGMKSPEQAIVLFDHSVQKMQSAVIGANDVDHHYVNFNFTRDCQKQMKFVKFCDLAESSVEQPIVELTKWNQTIQLMNQTGKLGPVPIVTVNIRWLEVLLERQKLDLSYGIVQVLPKFADQFLVYKNVAQKLHQKQFMICDERPKVTFGQKKEIAQSGVFSKIYVFSKDTTEGEVAVMNWENGEWVEGREAV
uniref:Aminoacyl-tRNA editing domain-containing protein n=1 Tax=Trepomonas sp. PC1 TaxID=1076344 RepID=A0A146K325_9EUKA|eukprot:JAP91283.1 Aminoacyl-tRNA editing domain-containing protein [Trepomonas sp. PC1]